MTGTAFTEAKEFEEVYKLKTARGSVGGWWVGGGWWWVVPWYPSAWLVRIVGFKP